MISLDFHHEGLVFQRKGWNFSGLQAADVNTMSSPRKLKKAWG